MYRVFVVVGLVAGCGGDPAPAHPAPAEPVPDVHQFKHADDDDIHPVTFAGAQHPFWQRMHQQIHDAWAVPSVHAPGLAVVECVRVLPDGTIPAVKRDDSSGDVVYDHAADRAVAQLQQDRNAHPEPVPTDLLSFTTTFICFRFKDE